MLIKNNIMHRDIKRSNILIHNGILKLADFGFCKPLKDARDLSQTMLGSPVSIEYNFFLLKENKTSNIFK